MFYLRGMFLTILSSLMFISFVESEDSVRKTSQDSTSELKNVEQLFNVEGKALLRNEMSTPLNWQANSRVLLDYGKYIGFIRYFFFKQKLLDNYFKQLGL